MDILMDNQNILLGKYYGRSHGESSTLSDVATHKSFLACTKCDAFFVTKYSLTRHYKRLHNDTRPHKCVKCEKGFKQSAHLSYHVKAMHTKKVEPLSLVGASLPHGSPLQADNSSLQQVIPTQVYTSPQAEISMQVNISEEDIPQQVDISEQEDTPQQVDISEQEDTPQQVDISEQEDTPQQVDISEQEATPHQVDISSQMATVNRSIHTQEEVEDFIFSCSKCDLIFRSGNCLSLHYKNAHNDDRPHKCEKCGKGFKQTGHLSYHIQSIHEMTYSKPSEAMSTQVDTSPLMDSTSLMDTTPEKLTPPQVHTSAGIYSSSLEEILPSSPQADTLSEEDSSPLSESLAQVDNLLHMDATPQVANVNSNNFGKLPVEIKKCTLSCVKCDQKFSTVNSRTRHYKRAHNDDRPHKCIICMFEFKAGNNLRAHMARSHGKVYNSKFNKSKHTKSVSTARSLPSSTARSVSSNVYTCSICDETFLARHPLTAHYKEIHNDYRPYKCLECKVGFKLKGSLNYHITVHHNESPTDNSKTDSTPVIYYTMTCRICKAPFKNITSLSVHYKVVHKDSRPFKCLICGYRFTQESNLVNHRNQCHGKYSRNESVTELYENTQGSQKSLPESEHICIISEAPFTTKHSLTHHYTVVHKDNRPHRCTICGQGFKLRNQLFFHKMRMHKENIHAPTETEEGALKCSICGYSFKLGSNLQRHMRNMHIDGAEYKEMGAEVSSEIVQSKDEFGNFQIEEIEPTKISPDHQQQSADTLLATELTIEPHIKIEQFLPDINSSYSLEPDIKIKQIKREQDVATETNAPAAGYRAPIIIYYDC